MPKQWDQIEPTDNITKIAGENVQIQSRRAGKHVTLFSRSPVAEGAGKPVIKQTFTECAKLTRNEPIKEERNRIISDCMKGAKAKGEFGPDGINVRESRGKFSDGENGKPGLKGTFLVQSTKEPEDPDYILPTRVGETEARIIRSGGDVPGVSKRDEMSEEVHGAEVDDETKNILCEYELPLTQYLQAVENKDYGQAAILEEEMRQMSECEVCHGIIDEVVADAEAYSDCKEDCDPLLAKLQATVEWAKGAFCPEHKK